MSKQASAAIRKSYILHKTRKEEALKNIGPSWKDKEEIKRIAYQERYQKIKDKREEAKCVASSVTNPIGKM